MSDYLVPEEILIKILVKLPVKSLIRGTSVCKQWRSLIRCPSFISAHLSNSETQALVRHYDKRDNREHYTVIPKRGPFLINSIEFPFISQIYFSRIMGSCDGLVCLSDYYSLNSEPRIIIWNPAIRNHVVLPQPFDLVNPYNESHHVDVHGFGVANNVDKVVRLVYRQNPNGHGFIVLPQAEIFCLGTRRWRKLTRFDHVRGLVPQYPRCPIFFEGFVHWICYDPIGGENNKHNSILRFHVGDEVFGEIMLPQELDRVPLFTSVRLYMMGEKLGACKHDDRDNLMLDVWMMKDYGVEESWTKLYTIDSLIRIDKAIGFWGGEALLFVNGCELVSYNPETKGIKHVLNFGKYNMLFYAGDYKESLVLLGGYSGGGV